MNSDLQTQVRPLDDAVLLTAFGVLDSSTYIPLRDAIIKAALDHPSVVIADITALRITADSALSVFTSARWHVSRWPAVPISLVCPDSEVRDRLRRNDITRCVSVYRTVTDAVAATPHPASGVRRHEQAELPALPSSIALARALATEWCTDWLESGLIPVAKIIVTILVENALSYSDGPPGLRLEVQNGRITVAVEDNSTALPEFQEDGSGAQQLSGLKIVDALCVAWGCNPIPEGKAVWAVLESQDRA